MRKVSFIIPARHEIYLQETVSNILENATGKFEIIVVLDGYWPKPTLKDDPRLILIHRDRRGLRAAVNDATAISTGNYILKIDAHVAIAPGFNEALAKDYEEGCIFIPRRYALDWETWGIKRHRQIIDYEYLCYPDSDHGRICGKAWKERDAQRANRLIDETMTFQGSCWFMSKKHFYNLGGMNEEGYGIFVCEAQELGLKTWLGGGKIMVNKKTWYAHLWKGKPYRNRFRELYGKQYTRIGHKEFVRGQQYTTDFWMNNRWEDRQHDIEWLVKKFWPVPTWEGKI